MARVNFESIAYRDPLAGAAWWASSRISSEPGRKSPSQSRSVAVYASSISSRCETRKRVCVVQGLIP